MSAEISDYLGGLTDAELLAQMDVAKSDLTAASQVDQNSEWHQSCFAGVIVLGEEIVRRGIATHIVH